MLDSLVYVSKRAELLAADSVENTPYIQAADELAEMGLYGKARELLDQLISKPAKDLQTDSAPMEKLPGVDTGVTKPDIGWRISLGADYFDMNVLSLDLGLELAATAGSAKTK